MTAYKIDVNYNGFIKYSSITNSEIEEIKTKQTTPIHILINVGKGFDITTTDITLFTTGIPDSSTTPITTTSTATGTVTPTVTPIVTVTPTLTPEPDTTTPTTTSSTATATVTNPDNITGTPEPVTATPTPTEEVTTPTTT